MLPPTTYAFDSCASLESAWKVGDWASDGGEGRRVSQYFGKYFVPYGELKHSGSTTMLAPFEVASSTFDRARARLAALSEPASDVYSQPRDLT